MIYVFPQVVAMRPFERVGFYTYRSLKNCVLKAMSSNLVLSSPLPEEPPTKAVLVGRFHHQLMRRASTSMSRKELDLAIEREIAELQRRVDSEETLRRYGSVSGWVEVNRSARAAVAWLADGARARLDRVAASEELLAGKTAPIVGRPDYFSAGNETSCLVEFKSSSLTDDLGVTKEEYAEQLLFYAALLYQNFTTHLVVASLQSMSGESITSQITLDEASEYAAEAHRVITVANELIRTAASPNELSTPSAEACRYCQKKIICHAFRKSQESLGLDDFNSFVIHGSVRRIEKNVSASALIELSDLDSGVTKTVRLPTIATEKLSAGDIVTVSGLSKRGAVFIADGASHVFR